MSDQATLAVETALIRQKTLKYLSVIRINARNTLAYLVNALSRSAIVVLRIWIFTQLYTASYAMAGATDIGGLTLPMAIWSLMLTQSFQSAARPMLVRILDEEVKTGKLAYSVNRPYSYMLFHLSGYLGRSAPNLITNLMIGALAAIFLVGPLPTSLIGIALGAALLCLGYMLDFCMQFIIGLLGFWLEDTAALVWIYTKGQFVLGGVILPLALFPGALGRLASLLPFGLMYYGPARIMVNFDFGLFKEFILMQFVWIAVFGLAALLIFKKSLKYVSINGG